jgi:microcystin-dependent protein
VANVPFALAECSAGAGPGGGGPPVGSVVAWLTATPPSGYLLCDGTAVSRATYDDLFDVIGTTFGVGDNSTTFNLPNLRGRFPVGLDSAQAEFDALGETGGAKTVALDVTMMPSHTHVQDAHTHVQDSHNHTQVAHSHTVPVGATDDTAAPFDRADAGTNASGANASTATGTATATNQAATAVNQSATATNQATGGGLAHANLPPYLVVNYVIKA